MTGPKAFSLLELSTTALAALASLSIWHHSDTSLPSRVLTDDTGMSHRLWYCSHAETYSPTCTPTPSWHPRADMKSPTNISSVCDTRAAGVAGGGGQHVSTNAFMSLCMRKDWGSREHRRHKPRHAIVTPFDTTSVQIDTQKCVCLQNNHLQLEVPKSPIRFSATHQRRSGASPTGATMISITNPLPPGGVCVNGQTTDTRHAILLIDLLHRSRLALAESPETAWSQKCTRKTKEDQKRKTLKRTHFLS